MKPEYRRNSVLKILLCFLLIVGGYGFADNAQIPAFGAKKTTKVSEWGLVVQDMNDDMLESVGLKESFGVIITQLISNSPATHAALKQGDVIIAINGRKLHSRAEFDHFTSNSRIGEVVVLTVWRDSRLQVVELIPVEPQPMHQQFNDQFLQGAEFIETDNGVIVQKPDRGGLFAKGDQVLRLNGRAINSINDINTALESDRQSISVEVRRKGALISRSFSAGQNGNFFSQSIIVQ